MRLGWRRAFGAHPRRTERTATAFGRVDVAFVVGCWVVSAAVVLLVARLGLLGRLSLTG